jgi:hypothetical protein
LLYVTGRVCATTTGYISAPSSVHDLVHGGSDPGNKTRSDLFLVAVSPPGR